jgi:dTDP-4-dehydrorhamnose reductase
MTAGVEIWGGLECTVNRVGDRWLDQVVRTGHATRDADLELFAGLGLRTLRYPVLWERVVRQVNGAADWSWSDDRLATLRRLGIRPIVGLVHHGSGPPGTDLLDPDFAPGLARYATDVARRYPWITDYTPVNEPLTTARFAGLYGHWHPHARDDRSFVRTFLNQCRGIVLAMRAIREVNPSARLVQTEDLGRTFSTPPLEDQARFENERRWLTGDLLCGRVGRDHPLWAWLISAGAPADDLRWFADNAVPPDVMGINHYMTSERFLDHRVERYPEHARGGNGRSAYADVEAVRVLANGVAGPRALLDEAWNRYRLPLAVTEVHLNCTREEQLRWFHQVWAAAVELREAGVDVRAITAWSLLGSFDWISLLTREDGHYEPGVFDLRSPSPRPTALAALLKELTSDRAPSHPVLDSPGWWQKDDRLIYDPVHDSGATAGALGAIHRPRSHPRPILVTGARGTLAQAFVRICRVRGLEHVALDRAGLDIADPDQVAAVLDRLKPWAVVNAAGFVRVDDAEAHPAACYRDNTEGPDVLARASAARGIRFVTYSSDLVFGNGPTSPRMENELAEPLGVYGKSKRDAELAVLSADPRALVIRTGAFFGPWDGWNFPAMTVRALQAGRSVTAALDVVVSPTYVPDLVGVSLDLLMDGEAGMWHLANSGAMSWADLARRTAERFGFPASAILALPQCDLGFAAPRPSWSALGSARGTLLRSFDEAFEAWAVESDLRSKIDDALLVESV